MSQCSVRSLPRLASRAFITGTVTVDHVSSTVCRPKCDAQRLDMLASCSVEAPTLESVRSVELAIRTPEDPCSTSTELETKQNVKEANTCRLRSSNTSLSHFSCTLRKTHQSRGTERKEPSFLQRATAERCIVVMCRLGRSWYRGLWDKKTRERNKEPDVIEANVSWAPLACGCFGGAKKKRSDSGAAEMSMERGEGVSDFCLEAA